MRDVKWNDTRKELATLSTGCRLGLWDAQLGHMRDVSDPLDLVSDPLDMRSPLGVALQRTPVAVHTQRPLYKSNDSMHADCGMLRSFTTIMPQPACFST